MLYLDLLVIGKVLERNYSCTKQLLTEIKDSEAVLARDTRGLQIQPRGGNRYDPDRGHADMILRFTHVG